MIVNLGAAKVLVPQTVKQSTLQPTVKVQHMPQHDGTAHNTVVVQVSIIDLL